MSLTAGPSCLSPTSQPQAEQREEVASISDLAAGGGLNGHTPPTSGEPLQVLRPRGPGGACEGQGEADSSFQSAH